MKTFIEQYRLACREYMHCTHPDKASFRTLLEWRLDELLGLAI